MNRTVRHKGEISATLAPTLVVMLGFFCLFALGISASEPTWWVSSGVLNGNPANDYMVANQGQLKQFTARTVTYLNSALASSGGAGPALSNMVYTWQTNYTANGWSATNPKPSDYYGVNQGQLKYIAGLVDGRLADAGYTGLTPSWLHANPTSDYEAANIGQLKQVFDFDLSVAPGAITNLVATPNGSGEIDLSWTNPSMNNALGIVIYYSIDGGITWSTLSTNNPASASAALTGLNPDASYQFKVGSSNGSGSSTPTTPTTAIPPAPSPRYAVVDLGTNFYPAGINSNAMVVGNTTNVPPYNGHPSGYAEVWSPSTGTVSFLTVGPDTSQGTNTYASSINDSGVVAGGAYFTYPAPSGSSPPAPSSKSELLACSWASSTSSPTCLDGQHNTASAHNSDDIWLGAGVYYSYASAMNNAGVYGNAFLDNANSAVGAQFSGTAAPVSAFTGITPANFDFGDLGTPTYVTAAAGGHVYGTGTQTSLGFYVLDTETLTLLGFAGSYVGIPDMNTNGVAAGYYFPTNTSPIQPMTIQGNTVSNLPGTGQALAINNLPMTSTNAPQIVGVDSTGTNAMLWDYTTYSGTNTTAYVQKDLNRLIPGYGTTNPPPWHVTSTVGINDSGAIVGTATYTQSGNNTNITNGQHGVVLAPAYEIQVDAYIPQEWVSNPANTAIQALLGSFWSLIGSPELVYYGGDQRKVPLDASFNTGTATFQKNLSYRLRQKVMATAFQEYDPTGSQEQEESNEAQNSITGASTLYLGYQISGGHIAPGQAPLLTQHATPSTATVTVTHPSSRVVNSEFIMQAANPLAPGSDVGPIYYDLIVSIDDSNPAAPTYTLTGNHKLFPAYEVYINQQLVHDYSPIPGNHQPSDLVLLPGASVPSVSDTSITAGTTKPLTGAITP